MLLKLKIFIQYLYINLIIYINYHLIFLLFISYLLSKNFIKYIHIINIIILSFFIYNQNYLFINLLYSNQFFFKYQIITFHSLYIIFKYHKSFINISILIIHL